MWAEGNQEVWKWMLDKYKVESNAQEKLKLLRGLTCIGEPWILSHLLELARMRPSYAPKTTLPY